MLPGPEHEVADFRRVHTTQLITQTARCAHSLSRAQLLLHHAHIHVGHGTDPRTDKYTVASFVSVHVHERVFAHSAANQTRDPSGDR